MEFPKKLFLVIVEITNDCILKNDSLAKTGLDKQKLKEHIELIDFRFINQVPHRILLHLKRKVDQIIEDVKTQRVIKESSSLRIFSAILNLLNRICLVCLDDIIIYNCIFEAMLENLWEIFAKLCMADVKINPKNNKFFKKEVKYLGHNNFCLQLELSLKGLAHLPDYIYNWIINFYISYLLSSVNVVTWENVLCNNILLSEHICSEQIGCFQTYVLCPEFVYKKQQAVIVGV
uniref:Uncharacterized protein n=1 Tax=Vespula pensylvanica TaxID=30213 RepID=A0A834UEH9_VESPE|nr:hypothetical protein H0235_003230 [Vespula pensylvanica]